MARILVVDEDPQVRSILRAMLTEAGHEVAEAGGGREALLAFQLRPADLVLFELLMASRDESEALREFAAAFKGAKVIALSGSGFSGIMDLFRAVRLLGAAGLLHKPFDRATVLAAIAETLPPPADD
jgi:DNA-binding NtrC family response regulator